MPNNAGFFTYADSIPRTFNGGEAYRYLAARFKDGASQRVAELMESGSPAPRIDPGMTDDSVPACAPPKLPAASGEAIVRQMKDFTRVGDVPEPKARVGAIGPVSSGWSLPNTQIETKFNVPADGAYRLLVKYASDGRAVRSFWIDGKPPFREAQDVAFLSTGGWSNLKNQFVFVELPWLFPLAKGEHTLTVRCESGGGFNLDWLAFVPPAMSKETVIARMGDTDAHVEPVKDKVLSANWRGLFWYDASVPAISGESLPVYGDSADLGLYTARSSWTDPRATWFGFKCGPPSGMTVLSNFGPALVSGHCDPDAGTFLFYAGGSAVVPGSNYEHIKATASHPVVLVESTRKGQRGTPFDRDFAKDGGEGGI